MVEAVSNPTTGYEWSVISNTCGVRFAQVSSEHVDPSDEYLMGAPGKHVWTFETPPPDANYVRDLPCTLEFKYKQPWNTDSSMTVNKAITVSVN